MDLNELFNLILKRPKLILILIILIIVLFGISSIFTSTDGGAGSGHDLTVYGINFHTPTGFEESSRDDLTNGEVVSLKDENGYIIEISVRSDEYFKESKYIDTKFSKTINNKEGTVYTYKPYTNMAYVYYDQGNLVVIRGASFTELEEIIV